jgi:pimeloyl-ACP methyl ester carboxylesterase
LGVSLYRRTWGSGDPVIALHPLGLESSAFAGVGRVLARRGLRTVALDLPGFGKTPASDVPLTAQHMAEPVIEMARRMKSPPVVIGISMGGRVALEAALQQPEAFRAVVPIAPWLPWLRMRALLRGARLLHPRAAERWLPLERAWPALRWLAHTLRGCPSCHFRAHSSGEGATAWSRRGSPGRWGSVCPRFPSCCCPAWPTR